MKRCAYCGTECPDDAVLCPIDRTPFDEPIKAVTENSNAAASPAVSQDPDQIYPEYRWSARDGWKFLGMILVFDFLWYLVWDALYRSVPQYAAWHRGPYGSTIMTLLFVAMNVLIAAYFARTETVTAFCKATGLDRKPTNYAWFGVVMALGIRLMGHIIYVLGLARGYPNYELIAFQHGHGRARYLYLFPVVLAAFWEEPVKRGFAYKAFRGSYSIPASIAIILVYTAYAHWYQYVHLGWAVFSLSALTVVQCYLREKSDSIWDCILCHLVFNGSSLFIAEILR